MLSKINIFGWSRVLCRLFQTSRFSSFLAARFEFMLAPLNDGPVQNIDFASVNTARTSNKTSWDDNET
jgi:hypothetical protein